MTSNRFKTALAMGLASLAGVFGVAAMAPARADAYLNLSVCMDALNGYNILGQHVTDDDVAIVKNTYFPYAYSTGYSGYYNRRSNNELRVDYTFYTTVGNHRAAFICNDSNGSGAVSDTEDWFDHIVY